MSVCLEYLKKANDANTYTGEGKHKHPTMTIKLNKEHEVTYLILPDKTLTVGRASEDDEKTKLPKPSPDYIMLCPHKIDTVPRKIFEVKYDSEDDTIKATILKYAPNDDPTSRPIWELNHVQLKHADPKKFTIGRDFNLEVKLVVRKDMVFDIKFKWPLQRLMTCRGYEAETQPGDETQNYNPLGGSAAGGGGGAGGVGGAGGTGAAGADVFAIDDKVVDDIKDRLDKTRVNNAYFAYALNPANNSHMDDLRAEIDTKFPEGTKVPFGKPAQVAQTWWIWAKKEENKEIVKVYAKIASDFNLENKASRPEKKKRKRKSKKAKKSAKKSAEKSAKKSSSESADEDSD